MRSGTVIVGMIESAIATAVALAYRVSIYIPFKLYLALLVATTIDTYTIDGIPYSQ